MAARPAVPEERILQAASELIAERGYRGTTTTAIAERAGINEVTLFRRFGSKQGVLDALTRSWTRSMAGMAVRSFPDDSDVRGTLSTLARMEIEGASRYGVAAMRLAMEAATTPELQAAMSDNPDQNLAGLANYLADRQRDGSVRADLSPWVMADAFFAMTSTQLMARTMLHLDNPGGLETDDIAEQLIELFCSAVLVKGEDS